MKIYSVTYAIDDFYSNDDNSIVENRLFVDEKLARHFLERKIEEVKEDIEEPNAIFKEVSENYYQRVINNQFDPEISIYMDVLNTDDEEEKRIIENEMEKDNDYDI